ncbi:MAG: hypothetical protein AB2693_27935, partial [Candidatus Thiodiazotropha sp.]
DTTGIRKLLDEANKQSTNAMKDMTDTMKNFLKQNETTTNTQLPSFQEESTQIFLEQESRKLKQSIIETWNRNLTKRRTEFWQQIRNDNTCKLYETWKNNAPMIIPRKLQMKFIEGEPLTQTQRRERQVIYNYQTDIELLELRARSHEEKVHSIDQQMEELINQKTTGQRRELLMKNWKDECEQEERTSLQRWENSNLRWFTKYEKEFLTFFEHKNPLIKDDKFMPPKIKESTQEQNQQTNDRQTNQDKNTEDDDVIVTGTSYAAAAKKNINSQKDSLKTTYIGKNVRFTNRNNFQNKPQLNKKQLNQTLPIQGSLNQPYYKNPNLYPYPQQRTTYRNRRRADQEINQYPAYQSNQTQNIPNTDFQNADRNRRYETNIRSNNFLYRGNQQTQNR